MPAAGVAPSLGANAVDLTTFAHCEIATWSTRRNRLARKRSGSNSDARQLIDASGRFLSFRFGRKDLPFDCGREAWCRVPLRIEFMDSINHCVTTRLRDRKAHGLRGRLFLEIFSSA
jgi:hypothetical protein